MIKLNIVSIHTSEIQTPQISNYVITTSVCHRNWQQYKRCIYDVCTSFECLSDI